MPEEDQGRWLSYQELGDVLGCTSNAARMHAVRRKWPRRASNTIGELARVRVPEDVVVRPRATHAVEQCDAQCNAPVPANGHTAFDAQIMLQAIRETVEALVTPLREQLDHERKRADAERVRADSIEVDLIKARVEPAGLRCQLEQARPSRPDLPRSPWRRFLGWRRAGVISISARRRAA
jgi:hypothetical protein